ncbi:hypothetical protein [Nocardia stercoris]|uniref:Uncharacterized protein n=1 Tax=Nocardia stercoris TaxID=2483361 RepID=A0A3M2L788_9NOCA|nr:hypothetical protein [Nocardia stercoris]RMI32590.1 hypothetical protein EBN03_11455 [Nocardia stercoris]
MDSNSPGAEPDWEHTAALPLVAPLAPRKLAKVPFVELAGGRLQGVVSSGSDIGRVYVASVTSGTHGLSCSTNNNRPCGGLNHGYACKHLTELIAEGVTQFGQERVARYLRVDVPEGSTVAQSLSGHRDPAPAAEVFGRFLRHLTYLELPAWSAPLPELQWFPATGVRR